MKSVVPHSVSADTFIDSVESNAMYGLSVKEAKLRLESAGYNRIEEKDKNRLRNTAQPVERDNGHYSVYRRFYLSFPP